MNHFLKSLIFLGFVVASTTSFKSADRMPASAPGSIEYSKEFSDLGEIKAEGENIHVARAKVSTTCFDRRLNAFEKQRGHLPDEDQADLIIESCVNIK